MLPSILRVLKRAINKNPFVTARQIRENNSVLRGMCLTTIRKALREKLHYKRRVAKNKPLSTARQRRIVIENFHWAELKKHTNKEVIGCLYNASLYWEFTTKQTPA